jgi:predicted nucleotidyltransferase
MLTLINTTGIPHIDRILREIISWVECRLRDRIRGYYLVGSYAVGEAVITSDLDMVVVFKGSLDPEEKQQFTPIKDECQQFSSLAIDLTPMGEADLFRVGGVRFQTASLLMYGEDIRAAVPQKPVEDHIRDGMHFQYRLFARVRGNPEVLAFPLDYPDPEGEFYGYDWRQIRTADGTSHAGIKDLALNVLCPAEALTLLKARRYVGTGRKSDISTQYRLWINDEWTTLVEAIDEYCRKRWAYLVPEASDQRQQLRALCERALGFENHFLAQYKEYLLAQLPQAEPFVQLHYVKRLGQLVYPDRAVVTTLQALENSSNAEIRLAIAETLRRYSSALPTPLSPPPQG